MLRPALVLEGKYQHPLNSALAGPSPASAFLLTAFLSSVLTVRQPATRWQPVPSTQDGTGCHPVPGAVFYRRGPRA